MKEMWQSKKFKAAMIASIVAVINAVLEATMEVRLDEQTMTVIVGSLLAYILGQGIADHGKEAARIQNGAGAVKTSDRI